MSQTNSKTYTHMILVDVANTLWQSMKHAAPQNQNQWLNEKSEYNRGIKTKSLVFYSTIYVLLEGFKILLVYESQKRDVLPIQRKETHFSMREWFW